MIWVDMGRLQQWQIVAINAKIRYVSASLLSRHEITRPADHRLCRLWRAAEYNSSWSQMQVDMQQLFNVVHAVSCCTDCVLVYSLHNLHTTVYRRSRA